MGADNDDARHRCPCEGDYCTDPACDWPDGGDCGGPGDEPPVYLRALLLRLQTAATEGQAFPGGAVFRSAVAEFIDAWGAL